MKRLAILVTFFIVITAVASGVWLYMANTVSGSVSFNSVPGATVSLYKKGAPADVFVKNLVSKEKFSVSKGDYVLYVKGTNIQQDKKAASLNRNGFSVSVDVSYSTDYLATLLSKEQSAITNAINQQLPKLAQLYTVRPGKLYLDGSWYGTRLRYIGPETTSRDTLRLIAQKTSTGWRVVTTPPQIFVPYIGYESVPRSVVNDVNSDDIPRNQLR